MRLLSRPRQLLRAGFTLIELLAVIAIISLLAIFLVPKIPEAFDAAKVLGCKKNMEEIFKGLMIYDTKFGDVPTESGVGFFASLIADGAFENTKPSAERLTCPAIKKSALSIGDLPYEEWYSDLELVDGSFSAYAGRNTQEFPLRQFPGKGRNILVADDNDPDMNHSTTTVALYDDGSVRTFEIATLRKEGVLDPEEELLIVGPESPVEDLQKLSLD